MSMTYVAAPIMIIVMLSIPFKASLQQKIHQNLIRFRRGDVI